jgi:hypothetical protein
MSVDAILAIAQAGLLAVQIALGIASTPAHPKVHPAPQAQHEPAGQPLNEGKNK